MKQLRKACILLRDAPEVATGVGDTDVWPRTFFGEPGIAADSKGDIDTAETCDRKRVQRLVCKGLGPISAASR